MFYDANGNGLGAPFARATVQGKGIEQWCTPQYGHTASAQIISELSSNYDAALGTAQQIAGESESQLLSLQDMAVQSSLASTVLRAPMQQLAQVSDTARALAGDVQARGQDLLQAETSYPCFYTPFATQSEYQAYRRDFQDYVTQAAALSAQYQRVQALSSSAVQQIQQQAAQAQFDVAEVQRKADERALEAQRIQAAQAAAAQQAAALQVGVQREAVTGEIELQRERLAQQERSELRSFQAEEAARERAYLADQQAQDRAQAFADLQSELQQIRLEIQERALQQEQAAAAFPPQVAPGVVYAEQFVQGQAQAAYDPYAAFAYDPVAPAYDPYAYAWQAPQPAVPFYYGTGYEEPDFPVLAPTSPFTDAISTGFVPGPELFGLGAAYTVGPQLVGETDLTYQNRIRAAQIAEMWDRGVQVQSGVSAPVVSAPPAASLIQAPADEDGAGVVASIASFLEKLAPEAARLTELAISPGGQPTVVVQQAESGIPWGTLGKGALGAGLAFGIYQLVK